MDEIWVSILSRLTTNIFDREVDLKVVIDFGLTFVDYMPTCLLKILKIWL